MLHADDIVEVIITDEGYKVNGVLTDEEDVALMIYLENGGIVMEPDIVGMTQEEIQAAMDAKCEIKRLGDNYIFRSGLISQLQSSAMGTASEPLIDAILRFTTIPVEKWKNTGDIVQLKSDLDALTGIQIRAALDMVIDAQGTVLTDSIISSLDNDAS